MTAIFRRVGLTGEIVVGVNALINTPYVYHTTTAIMALMAVVSHHIRSPLRVKSPTSTIDRRIRDFQSFWASFFQAISSVD